MEVLLAGKGQSDQRLVGGVRGPALSPAGAPSIADLTLDDVRRELAKRRR